LPGLPQQRPSSPRVPHQITMPSHKILWHLLKPHPISSFPSIWSTDQPFIFLGGDTWALNPRLSVCKVCILLLVHTAAPDHFSYILRISQLKNIFFCHFWTQSILHPFLPYLSLHVSFRKELSSLLLEALLEDLTYSYSPDPTSNPEHSRPGTYCPSAISPGMFCRY
jgi:hypothetical protein